MTPESIASPPLLEANPYAPPNVEPVPRNQEPSDLEKMVMSGYRFKTIPYVISAIFISFRRSMGGHQVKTAEWPMGQVIGHSFRRRMGGIHQVRTGEWPMGQVIGATCITCLLGWWGFPFGIAWTVISLFHLWGGGQDRTRLILTQALGAPEAKRILAAAPKPKPPGTIWLVRLLILIPVILIVTFFLSIILS